MIRKIKQEEIGILDEYLYKALYVHIGEEPFPRDIIYKPELQVYVENFGERAADICYVAEEEGRIVGAAWVRIMNDYGHVEDGVPSWILSLDEAYRGKGLGTELMKAVIEEMERQGYRKSSLSCQKENRAWQLYKRLGFEIIDENEEEYIMLRTAK